MLTATRVGLLGDPARFMQGILMGEHTRLLAATQNPQKFSDNILTKHVKYYSNNNAWDYGD